MKKQIFKRAHFLMSALALLLIMVISCAKESVQEDGIIEQAQAEEVLIDDKAIEADEDFIAMKNHMDITMELYRTTLQSKNVSMQTFTDMYVTNDEESLERVFAENQALILMNIKQANIHFEALKAKYPEMEGSFTQNCKTCDNNSLSPSDITRLENSNFLTVSGSQEFPLYECSWRYYFCLLPNGLPAAACVIASGPTIVVPYLCIAAYGAAGINCLLDWCTSI